jgi:hypothetical protein
MIIDTNDSCGLGFEEVHATRVSNTIDMPIPRYKRDDVLEEFV